MLPPSSLFYATSRRHTQLRFEQVMRLADRKTIFRGTKHDKDNVYDIQGVKQFFPACT